MHGKKRARSEVQDGGSRVQNKFPRVASHEDRRGNAATSAQLRGSAAVRGRNRLHPTGGGRGRSRRMQIVAPNRRRPSSRAQASRAGADDASVLSGGASVTTFDRSLLGGPGRGGRRSVTGASSVTGMAEGSVRRIRDLLWDETSGELTEGMKRHEAMRQREREERKKKREERKRRREAGEDSGSDADAADDTAAQQQRTGPLLSASLSFDGGQLTLLSDAEVLQRGSGLGLLQTGAADEQAGGERMVVEEDELDGQIRSTSASFRRGNKSQGQKRWTEPELKKFYEGVRRFGSDLTMINVLLPHRNRRQIKKRYMMEQERRPALLQAALSLAIGINEGKQQGWGEDVKGFLQQEKARRKAQGTGGDTSSDDDGSEDEEEGAGGAAEGGSAGKRSSSSQSSSSSASASASASATAPSAGAAQVNERRVVEEEDDDDLSALLGLTTGGKKGGSSGSGPHSRREARPQVEEDDLGGLLDDDPAAGGTGKGASASKARVPGGESGVLVGAGDEHDEDEDEEEDEEDEADDDDLLRAVLLKSRHATLGYDN